MDKITTSTLVPIGLVVTVIGAVFALGSKTEAIQYNAEKIKVVEQKIEKISDELVSELKDINKRLSAIESRLHKR